MPSRAAQGDQEGAWRRRQDHHHADILGLDAPTQGSVTVGGRSYRDLPAPVREVGALLDAKAPHGGRRAFDHLLCLARVTAAIRSSGRRRRRRRSYRPS
jgi:hypothetical protein